MTDTYRAEEHYAELFRHLRIMREALKAIREGEGDAQEIAREALEDCDG